MDIKFSRALNSCKLPQIRYASKERLFERLTDLRFLSIDFLNTFLLTYRVFTTAEDVLEALKSVHYNCEKYFNNQHQQQPAAPGQGNRDSFSTYANSSMTSLNNNSSTASQTVDSQQHEQQAPAPVPASPKTTTPANRHPTSPKNGPNSQDKSGSPVESSSDAGAPACTRPKQPPVVPPRSPGAAGPSPAPTQIGDHFLSAPSAHLNQKRRSTISALTPITGSSSSSLVNLGKNSQTSGSARNIQLQQQHLLSPNQQQMALSVVPRLQRNQNQLPSTSVSSNSSQPNCLLSDCDEQGVSSLMNDSDTDNALGQPDSATSPTITAAPSLVSSRLRSSSVCARTAQLVGGVRLAPSAEAPDPAISLAVPNNRQLRAGSLSNVSIKSPLTPDGLCGSGLAVANNTDVQLESGHSHQAHPEPLVAGTGAAGNHRRLLLAPSYLPVGAGAPIRRKSAADADNFRPQVTLEPPPVEMQQAASAEEQLTSRLRHFYPIRVPPPSPVGRPADNDSPPLPADEYASAENNNKEAGRQGNVLHTPKGRYGHRDEAKQRQKVRRKTKVSAVSSTSSSPVVPLSSSCSSQPSSEHSPTTGSVSTSQSESGLIQSSSSSSSLDAAARHHHRAKVSQMNGLPAAGGGGKSAPASGRCLAPERASGGAAGFARPGSRRRQCERLVIKEIDLTQAKVIDCDTSADESDTRVSTSSDEGDTRAVVVADPADRTDEPGARRPARLAHGDDDTAGPDRAGARHARRPDALTTQAGGRKGSANASSARACQASTNDGAAPKCGAASRQQQVSAARGGDLVAAGEPDAATRQAKGAGATSSSCATTPRGSFQHTAAESLLSSKAGVVVTSKSPRVSSRRSSTASAASAFAAATAASCNPLLTQPRGQPNLNQSPNQHQHQRQRQTGVSPVDQPPGRLAHLSSHYQGAPTSAAAPASASGCAPGASASPAAQSDASVSNSRASSRLSSCAGLESNGASAPPHAHPQPPLGARAQPQLLAGSRALISGKHQMAAGSATNSTATNNSRLSAGILSSATPASQQQQQSKRSSTTQIANSAINNVRAVATLRVLSVLRHWVSKHSQDFANDAKLANAALDFLQDLIMDAGLLPAEHKAAIQLQQMIQKAAHARDNQVDLDVLLAQPAKPSPDSVETLSALEIAEGMTYLDHKIFLAIKSEEFLGQAWMKADKAIKAPHILLITKRFNDVSRLVSSEIIRVPELHRRVAIIEKWTNVAHICRVIHNFNGVLQICAAFTNSAVFRLKKTWDKIPKTVSLHQVHLALYAHGARCQVAATLFIHLKNTLTNTRHSLQRFAPVNL